MDINYYPQEKEYTCGPACMRMVLSACGFEVSEQFLEKSMKTNKIYGTKHMYFPKIAEKYKLKYSVMRYSTLEHIKEFLSSGYISVVCYKNLFLDDGKWYFHYGIVRQVGTEYVHMFDPKLGSDHKIDLETFDSNWHSHPYYEKDVKWVFATKSPVAHSPFKDVNIIL